MLYIHKRSYGTEVHRIRSDHDCTEVDHRKLSAGAQVQAKSYIVGGHEFIGAYNLYGNDGCELGELYRNKEKDLPQSFGIIYDFYWRKASKKMTFDEWVSVIPRGGYSRNPTHHGLYWDREMKLYYLTLSSDKAPVVTPIEENAVIAGYRVFTLTDLVEQRRRKLNDELEQLDHYSTLSNDRHIFDLSRAPDENNRLPFSDWIARLTNHRT